MRRIENRQKNYYQKRNFDNSNDNKNNEKQFKNESQEKDDVKHENEEEVYVHDKKKSWRGLFNKTFN